MPTTLTRRSQLILLAAAALHGCARATAQGGGGLRLRRGVNIHHMFNWPQASGTPLRYASPPFQTPDHRMDDAEIAAVAAAGFDFVRLTVDPAVFMAQPARRKALASQVAAGVERFSRAGLNVVVDLHPIGQNPAFAADALARPGRPDLAKAYDQTAAALARALAAAPPTATALELMNEPPITGAADLAAWSGRRKRLYDVARRAAPRLPLVLGGGEWSSLRQLVALDPAPFRGQDVLYTFHYYAPHLFTHQGVAKAVERDIHALPWPAPPGGLAKALAAARTAGETSAAPQTDRDRAARLLAGYFTPPAGPQAIKDDFAQVAAWADRHGVPRERILLGEFGAVAAAPGRLAWMEAVRRQAEAQGFAWAAWVYRGPGGMALTDPAPPHAFDPAALKALGLGQAERTELHPD